jgi:hypothetical protein
VSAHGREKKPHTAATGNELAACFAVIASVPPATSAESASRFVQRDLGDTEEACLLPIMLATHDDRKQFPTNDCPLYEN